MDDKVEDQQIGAKDMRRPHQVDQLPRQEPVPKGGDIHEEESRDGLDGQ